MIYDSQVHLLSWEQSSVESIRECHYSGSQFSESCQFPEKFRYG